MNIEIIKSCLNTSLISRYQYEVTKASIGISGNNDFASSLEDEILSRMSPTPERSAYTAAKYGDLGYSNLSNRDLVDLLKIGVTSTNPDERSIEGLTVEILQRMESGHPEYSAD